ncbi:MAG: hypothetical protein O3A53_15815 [Acidobacteria bacterium]|nr:hypothetical protein [Acidobacteriota bacterium]MDA1236254.1 hypothetical protein [Acidobacteriota bacterium]
MTRRLLLLNALLAGMFILGAAELYRQVVDADGRYERLEAFTDPKQPPEFPASGDPNPTRPADFMPVVDRLLFSPDRNAEVVVETAEVEVDSRPPLPQLSGLVDFGGGPSALMTTDSAKPPVWLTIGDKVGDFVYEGLEGEDIKLKWKEESFTATKEQLSRAPEPPKAVRQARGGPRQPQRPKSAGAAAPADLAGVGQDNRIGPEIGPGRYAVVRGDDSPVGTEHNGLVKQERKTPFGSSSWWEKKE